MIEVELPHPLLVDAVGVDLSERLEVANTPLRQPVDEFTTSIRLMVADLGTRPIQVAMLKKEGQTTRNRRLGFPYKSNHLIRAKKPVPFDMTKNRLVKRGERQRGLVWNPLETRGPCSHQGIVSWPQWPPVENSPRSHHRNFLTSGQKHSPGNPDNPLVRTTAGIPRKVRDHLDGHIATNDREISVRQLEKVGAIVAGSTFSRALCRGGSETAKDHGEVVFLLLSPPFQRREQADCNYRYMQLA